MIVPPAPLVDGVLDVPAPTDPEDIAAQRPNDEPSRSVERTPLTAEPTPEQMEALALCESGGIADIVDPSGLYFGLYQFDLTTWLSVGGSGNPADATPEEQTRRALLLYDERGWQPWPQCGANL